MAAQKCAEELARAECRRRTRVVDAADVAAVFVCYAGNSCWRCGAGADLSAVSCDRIEEYAERQSAILNNAGVCLLLTFRRAEAVAKLLKPRVKSLLGVVEAEKLLEAAEKAPPPRRERSQRSSVGHGS